MSNPTPNFLPDPDDTDDEQQPVPTREVDGETVLDEDADPDLIDSADADRIAAGNEDAVDAVEDVPAGGAGADSGAADAVQVDPDDEAAIPDLSETNDTPGVGTRRD
ncbi:hypothetical protein [Microbacterium sp.]|uniref:hypothetical protein n=1 Tax=Microbacterium sp. TaxID=51671 RepID=UPI0028128D39|nr:hypothetical protein [Microbacterium sp.]